MEEVEQPELAAEESPAEAAEEKDPTLKAVVEAAIYITDEPLTAEQIASALEEPVERVNEVLEQLAVEYAAPDRGLSVREIAGGYKMSTKAEHHDAVRRFVKNLQPPLKLSMAALETLAVIAYKQPITGPEILEIRGVQGAGVLKTLLDRKLIAAAGRKQVIGKPITYKTTREFLIQFGLDSLSELPTLKEFEDLGRLALGDEEEGSEPEPQKAEEPTEPQTTEDDGMGRHGETMLAEGDGLDEKPESQTTEDDRLRHQPEAQITEGDPPDRQPEPETAEDDRVEHEPESQTTEGDGLHHEDDRPGQRQPDA